MNMPPLCLAIDMCMFEPINIFTWLVIILFHSHQYCLMARTFEQLYRMKNKLINFKQYIVYVSYIKCMRTATNLVQENGVSILPQYIHDFWSTLLPGYHTKDVSCDLELSGCMLEVLPDWRHELCWWTLNTEEI